MNIPKIKRLVADAYAVSETDGKIPRWLAQFHLGDNGVRVDMATVDNLRQDDGFIDLLQRVIELAGHSVHKSTIQERLLETMHTEMEVTAGGVIFKAARATAIPAKPGEPQIWTCGCSVRIPESRDLA
jgi:hypothetical protein